MEAPTTSFAYAAGKVMPWRPTASKDDQWPTFFGNRNVERVGEVVDYCTETSETTIAEWPKRLISYPAREAIGKDGHV